MRYLALAGCLTFLVNVVACEPDVSRDAAAERTAQQAAALALGGGMTAVVVTATTPAWVPVAAVAVVGVALIAGVSYVVYVTAQASYSGPYLPNGSWQHVYPTPRPVPADAAVVQATPTAVVVLEFRYKRAQCTCSGANCANPRTIDVDMSFERTKSHRRCTHYVNIACNACGAGCVKRSLGCDGRVARGGNHRPVIVPVPAPTPSGVCGSQTTCWLQSEYNNGRTLLRANCSGTQRASAGQNVRGVNGIGCFRCDSARGWSYGSGCAPDPVGTPTPPPAASGACGSEKRCWLETEYLPNGAYVRRANCSGTALAQSGSRWRGLSGQGCFYCDASVGWKASSGCY